MRDPWPGPHQQEQESDSRVSATGAVASKKFIPLSEDREQRRGRLARQPKIPLPLEGERLGEGVSIQALKPSLTATLSLSAFEVTSPK